MDGDEALEDDGPGGVAQAVLQGAEDLADARLAGVGGDEDVLDVLGLGGRILEETRRLWVSCGRDDDGDDGDDGDDEDAGRT